MKSHSRVSHCPYRNLDAELKTGNIIQMQKTLLKTPTGSISKNKQEKVSVSKSKEKKMYKQQKFELRFNKHY